MEPPTDDVSQAHGLCGLDDEGLCGSDEERLALAQELIRQQYLGMCRETSAAGVKGAHFFRFARAQTEKGNCDYTFLTPDAPQYEELVKETPFEDPDFGQSFLVCVTVPKLGDPFNSLLGWRVYPHAAPEKEPAVSARAAAQNSKEFEDVDVYGDGGELAGSIKVPCVRIADLPKSVWE